MLLPSQLLNRTDHTNRSFSYAGGFYAGMVTRQKLTANGNCTAEEADDGGLRKKYGQVRTKLPRSL